MTRRRKVTSHVRVIPGVSIYQIRQGTTESQSGYVHGLSTTSYRTSTEHEDNGVDLDLDHTDKKQIEQTLKEMQIKNFDQDL